MSTLVERIQKSLDHANMSWSGAAIKIGLSAQAATNWKNGKISNDVLEKLAQLLEVDVCWLCFGDQYKEENSCSIQLSSKRFSKLIQAFEKIDAAIESGKLSDDEMKLLNGSINAINSMVLNTNDLVNSWIKPTTDDDAQKTA